MQCVSCREKKKWTKDWRIRRKLKLLRQKLVGLSPDFTKDPCDKVITQRWAALGRSHAEAYEAALCQTFLVGTETGWSRKLNIPRP